MNVQEFPIVHHEFQNAHNVLVSESLSPTYSIPSKKLIADEFNSKEVVTCFKRCSSWRYLIKPFDNIIFSLL